MQSVAARCDVVVVTVKEEQRRRLDLLLGGKGGRDFRVKDQYKSGTNGTQGIGTGSLEQGTNTFVGHNLGEAVHGALVHPFFLGLFRLHLQTTTDSIKGVGGVTGRDGRSLGADKLGGGTVEAVFVLLVRVVTREGVEQTKVDTTVRNDTNNGHTNTIVKGRNTTTLDGLDKTVKETIELLLSTTDIRSQTSTGVIEGVHNHQRSGTSQTTRSHVDGKELAEFSLLVSLGEQGLDGVLKGKVEGLCGEVTDNVGQVTTPESTNTLFAGHTDKAVHDTSVSGHLSTDNLGVGILGLDQKLDTLNGSGGLSK